jgi:hypothetical protein
MCPKLQMWFAVKYSGTMYNELKYGGTKNLKGNYQLFINKNNSWLTLPDKFQFKQLSSVFFNLHFINELNNERHKPPRTKDPWQKVPQYWNNHTILLHLFYIEGDIKRYLKELIQKIKYFKNIFFHIEL